MPLALMLSAASFSNNAEAQSGGCLASFNVDSGKTLNYFGWLPTKSSPGLSSMSCGAADALRTEIFVKYVEVIRAKALTPSAYAAELSARRRTLIQQRDDLRKSLDSKASIEAATTIGKVASFEVAKTSMLLGCFAPETGVGAVVCARGIVMTFVTGWNLFKRNVTDAQLRAYLNTLDQYIADTQAAYDRETKRTSPAEIQKVAENAAQAFAGLCKAIQEYCLK
ncbi:hypothetical protein [Bosea sp. CRIB-10]|uniref:hypothetical protein n=1 Tax=Bosea sp. CRIB-10 TaxID=378404 RepID=UPI000B88FD9A|nr:hypothetical protein [Bosea sp. CRIB-10]